jgi:hypothetical protein
MLLILHGDQAFLRSGPVGIIHQYTYSSLLLVNLNLFSLFRPQTLRHLLLGLPGSRFLVGW